jgi:hypothetical protein
MQNQVVSASFNGVPVSFSSDAYLNATEIAKQFGKRPVDFLKTEQAQEYINALAQKLSEVKKITSKENQLVIVRKGGNKDLQGTWLHPKLAIVFARWLSAEFAVWCDEQIENMLHPILAQQTLTPEQKAMIQKAVNARHTRTGEHWQLIYTKLHQFCGVNSYHEIKSADFDKAIEYLGHPAKQHQKAPALPHIAEDGRWLVIVRNNIVTHVRNINDYNCINADVFKKLRMQTKQQAEYLLELATRMRVIDGECSNSRLDVPIEESHPKFII